MQIWSFHQLRHSFCSALVRNGVSVEAVPVLAGHENLETTQRNVHPSAADLEAAMLTLLSRGEEWGFVCLRLPSLFDDPTGYHSPADSWGDMGAASIPLFGMLACEAALRGSARGPRTMIWASSERGLRGAVLLEAEVAR